jgi:RNA polymerase sigma-70 factor (ECF subfamily)
LARYRPEGKSLNWVYTIAGNLCKNFLRDRRFEPRVSLDEEVPGKEGIIIQDTIAQDGGIPSDLVISKEQEKLIQERIDQLPFKYRKILVLCDIQGCTYEEAARILKCNVRSVGSRLARARLILAESLKKYFKQR